MQIPSELLEKLLLSMLVGGIIGAEREFRSKSAGFRTMMLISMGATLFTMVSLDFGGNSTADRIAIQYCGGNRISWGGGDIQGGRQQGEWNYYSSNYLGIGGVGYGYRGG